MQQKELKFWQVDAFTNKIFKGNPAAIFILDEKIDEILMQNIASEMNLPETAFVLKNENSNPYLQWFTPKSEIDLCGHATLAAAHIYLTQFEPKLNTITFDTKFVGQLNVKKNSHTYTMNFPSRIGENIPLTKIPSFVFRSLSKTPPIEAYKSRDLMLIYENDQTIYDMQPNFNALLEYKNFIIVTAKSSKAKYDFISRFFCADDGIVEDPVTGSAHCTSAPYWSSKLVKKNLKAYQASERGGELLIKIVNDRIFISGEAITVIQGSMRI